MAYPTSTHLNKGVALAALFLIWKENLIEAFTLALIITFLMWLISPKKLKE